MSKLLISFLLVCYLGIIRANHHLIAAGCNTNKTCINFGTCDITTAPTGPNIATIYTEGANQISFQIQYNNSIAGWIAMGFSETRSMPGSYIFLCHRAANSGVNIQQRYAVMQSRPPLETSQLTAVSYSNSGSLLNCSFTAPVTIYSAVSGASIDLNNPAGYYVLLAWGTYTTDIQQHGNQMTNRCVTAGLMRITDAVGASGTSIIPTVQFIVAMLSLLFSFYIYM